jgi:gamma-glutamyltranspeptidase / glutathione hydrolase
LVTPEQITDVLAGVAVVAGSDAVGLYRIVVPGYSLSLQNRGHGYTLDRSSDNLVGQGKRPFHTIIPASLTKDGQPVMSYGVMDGDMQPQSHMQTLVPMLDCKQQPQAACDAPRWRRNSGLLNAKTGFDPATAQGLRDPGHVVQPFDDRYQDYGAGQFIWRLSGPDGGPGDPSVEGYAASDPRSDGQACGL